MSPTPPIRSHQLIHIPTASRALVPYESIVLHATKRTTLTEPLETRVIVYPPRRTKASKHADGISLSLCFQYLDVPSLLACRAASAHWRRASRAALAYQHAVFSIKRHRLHVQSLWNDVKHNLSVTNTLNHNLYVTNAFIHAVCHALPALRSVDLSGLQSSLFHSRVTEKCLRYVGQLDSLTALNLSHCTAIVTDRSILYLTQRGRPNCKLVSLNLDYCDSVTNQGLFYIGQSMRSLTSLSLSGCHRVTEILRVQSLTKLRSLTLAQCTGLACHTLNALKQLRLTSIDLSSTHCVNNTLQALAPSFPTLTSLNLSHCQDVDDGCIETLSEMKQLRVLDLSDCHFTHVALVRLRSMHATFPALLALDVSRWPLVDASLELVAILAPRLQVLSINQCTAVTSLTPLQRCSALHTVHANLCHALSDLTGLASLEHLLILSLWDCFKLTDASLLPLFKLPKLRKLNVCSCRALTDRLLRLLLNRATRLPQLQLLNVRFCELLSDNSKESLRTARRHCQIVG